MAGEGGGRGELVRLVLDSLAADAPDDATIIGLVRQAYDVQLAFVREHAIVTAYDDPVDVIEMPEIDRGVAVAYCDPPGPLETTEMPTFVAVSPTPRDWTADRVRSFYREYNRHMVQNLMVHEAMPGHVLQLGHARRFAGGTPVRAAFWSGSFVEGWAVYARGTDGRSRVPRRGKSRCGPDAAAQDAVAHDHQHDPGCPGALRGVAGSGGHGPDDRARASRKRAKRPANGAGHCSHPRSCPRTTWAIPRSVISPPGCGRTARSGVSARGTTSYWPMASPAVRHLSSLLLT